MQQETIDMVSAASSKVTVAGAGAAVVFGLTASELAAFLGVIVAFWGVIVNASVNWYYRHKTFKLEKAKYAKEGITEEA